MNLNGSNCNLNRSGVYLRRSNCNLRGSGVYFRGADCNLNGSGVYLRRSNFNLRRFGVNLRGSNCNLRGSDCNLNRSGRLIFDRTVRSRPDNQHHSAAKRQLKQSRHPFSSNYFKIQDSVIRRNRFAAGASGEGLKRGRRDIVWN